jgi:hypothetical protein
VLPTRLKESELIQVFEKYANGTIRNDLYNKYSSGNKPAWLKEYQNLKKPQNADI